MRPIRVSVQHTTNLARRVGAENGATPLHCIVEPLDVLAATWAVLVRTILSESEPCRAEQLVPFLKANRPTRLMVTGWLELIGRLTRNSAESAVSTLHPMHSPSISKLDIRAYPTGYSCAYPVYPMGYPLFIQLILKAYPTGYPCLSNG
jgi:hypothetical protein